MRPILALVAIFGVLPLVNAQGRVPVRDAATYDARDSHDGVTIVADAYDNTQEEKLKAAFGKFNPHHRNALPVYIVVFNPTKDAIKLEGMSVTLETGDGKKAYRMDGLKLASS